MSQLIQEWVIRQAERDPDRPAISFKKQRLTYGELDRQSNQLAELLRESGCHAGDRVAFCVPKSPAAIISMLAVLKADCVYVPIDSDCPPARVNKVLAACRPKWLLAGKKTGSLLSKVFADKDATRGVHVGCVNGDSLKGENFVCEFAASDLARFSEAGHSFVNSPSDAAHILFTSGSTGVPKGVVITHENAVEFVEWGVDFFGINQYDRVSGHAPLHFDLSTFDIYGAFAAGAELYPVPPELNLLPHKLAALEFLDESAVVAIDTDGFENKLICCAWVPVDGQEFDVKRIRSELAAHVPKYMVPSEWLQLDRLPKNVNGKIDRPELRRQFDGRQADAADQRRKNDASRIVPTV